MNILTVRNLDIKNLNAVSISQASATSGIGNLSYEFAEHSINLTLILAVVSLILSLTTFFKASRRRESQSKRPPNLE